MILVQSGDPGGHEKIAGELREESVQKILLGWIKSYVDTRPRNISSSEVFKAARVQPWTRVDGDACRSAGIAGQEDLEADVLHVGLDLLLLLHVGLDLQDGALCLAGQVEHLTLGVQSDVFEVDVGLVVCQSKIRTRYMWLPKSLSKHICKETSLPSTVSNLFVKTIFYTHTHPPPSPHTHIFLTFIATPDSHKRNCSPVVAMSLCPSLPMLNTAGPLASRVVAYTIG